jgi:hypothetical protein
MNTELKGVTGKIKQHQRDWATRTGGLVDDSGYFADPKDNLPWLTLRTRADFDAADGSEFGRNGKRGKIAASHSSSALAVNIFDYWRARDAGSLANALQVGEGIADISFEQKFATGVGPRSPNLDVVIRRSDDTVLAIESKFCESFGSKPRTIRDAYFKTPMWEAAGLFGAQQAANAVQAGAVFGCVDAPQLLKHMLGLASQDKQWHLLLLWFAPTRSAADVMLQDAEAFRDALGVDAARLSVRTYQDLWPEIARYSTPADSAYIDYNQARYFPSTAV